MESCSDGHDKVYYEGDQCPACKLGEEKYEEGYSYGYYDYEEF